jgi:transcriptional regulator with XRE-family HTH domain
VAFGQVLRAWRSRRGLSQERLALDAGTSPRHVSRLETGRVRPSAGMVQSLAEALDVPPHATVDLLAAAGLAPRPTPGATPPGRMLLAAVARVLDAHEPYPAFALDADWDVRAHNRAAGRVLAHLDPAARRDLNAARLALHPRGLAALAPDDAPWRGVFVARAAEQAARHPRGRLAALLPRLTDRATPADAGPEPDVAVPLRLVLAVGEVSLLAVATRFAAPPDAAVGALTIDTLLPADRASQRLLERLAREDDREDDTVAPPTNGRRSLT